jgi:hypothetical protein
MGERAAIGVIQLASSAAERGVPDQVSVEVRRRNSGARNSPDGLSVR